MASKDLGVVSSDKVFENLSFSPNTTGPNTGTKYKFTLKDEYIFGMTLTNSSGMSSMVQLYDEQNMPVMLMGGSGILSAGTYYVSCGTPVPGETYTLTLNCDKQLCTGTDSIANAYNLGVLSGTKDVDGIYLSPMETEYFKFTLSEASVLSLSATGGNPPTSPKMTFYDAEGTQLDIMSSPTGATSAEFAAGTYYVSLTGYGVGAADVVFTQSKVLCSGNDSIENAYDLGAISGTKDVDGIYLSSMETEYFKFTLSEASVLSLAATTGSNPPMSVMPTFYDAQGNDLNIMSGISGAAAEFAAGTYYVSLGGYTTGAMDVVFTQSKALCTGNNSIENAYDLGVISGTKDVDGVYLEMMEMEYFKFTLSEASVLSLSATTGSNPPMSAMMTFYDAEGTQLDIMSSPTGATSAEFAAGTYYVSLEGDGIPDVVFTQSKVLCTGNDDFETAYDLGTISGKKSFDGVSRVEMEMAEYYKFTIAEDSTVLLSVPAIPSEYGGMNFMVDIYDEEQNPQMGETDFETGTLKIDLAAGTYYVSLGGGSNGFTSLNFNVVKKDYDAPELPYTFSATVNDFDVTLDWNDVADKGEAGVKGYYVRYGSSSNLEYEESFFVSESSFTLEELCVGKWYYQVKAVDNVDNASDWSEVQTFEVRYPSPSNLQGGAAGLSWNEIQNVQGYVVEYSKDYFSTVFQVECCSNGVDSFALPEGYWQWRVSAIDGEFSTGNDFSSAKNNAPQKYISVANDKKDIFFANANGTWNAYFDAVYQGDEEIKAAVSLGGKNKIVDVFSGSADANMLILTDDANGDALFMDDIYSAFGSEQRLSRINEVYAGAGDDIVDLSTSRFDVSSEGMMVHGGDGNDTIWASGGRNIIFGDAGNDNIIGGDYNDIIVGGTGNDTLQGGGGYDIFCFGGDWGNDTVEQIAGGTAVLWFEDDNGEWDELTRTYTSGNNSVTFTGEGDCEIRCGYSGSEYFNLDSMGCFAEVSSEKIFDDKNKGTLA